MFDYLGTFTQAQLQERQAYLRRLVKAIPGKVTHLRKQASRLMGDVVETNSSQTQTVTSTVCDTSYTLGSITHPSLNHSLAAELVFRKAQQSGYGGRMDPLTRNVSLGDYTFRTAPSIVTADTLAGQDSFYTRTFDDAIAAVRSEITMAPARDLMKRQEQEEERLKKARYRGMRLLDRASQLEAAMETYEEELEAVAALLDSTTTIDNPDGTTKETSDYKSAGVDLEVKETGITPESDREDFFSVIFPPVEPKDSGETADLTKYATAAIPDEQVDLNIPDNARPGDIEEFLAEFPGIPRSLGRKKLQVMANVFEYGYKTGVLKSFSDGSALIRNPTGGKGTRDESGFRYLPPNVKSDLSAFAASANAIWGVTFRITEAWPASGNHVSPGHFTGNCVDMVLDLQTEQTGHLRNLILSDIADKVIVHGVRNGWIQSGVNEYKHETRYKTGPHIHLNMNVQYFNESKLFTLG